MARTLLPAQRGPAQIDAPQAVGYYGGTGVALAVGILEPPLAGFITAVPRIKILADSSALNGCGS